MKREDVYTVRIYFIKPIDLIQVVVNTLLALEYETYTISDYEAERLLRVLPANRRSIVFFCVTNKQEMTRWLDYGRRAMALQGTSVQVGAFVYTNMEPELRQQFLEAQIPAISFASIQNNTVQVLQQILRVFDAKGTRSYVRVKTRGISLAFVTIKGRQEPARCAIKEISAFAFVCEIDPEVRPWFDVGSYLPEVMLTLRGIRIRTAVRILGFSRANRNLYILRFCGIELKDNKMSYTDKIPGELRQKVHAYIRSCLRENLSEQLEQLDKTEEESSEKEQTDPQAGDEPEELPPAQ